VKAIARSHTYNVHDAEIMIKAHLSPLATQSWSGVGSRDTCVLEGRFEIDSRSKGRASGVTFLRSLQHVWHLEPCLGLCPSCH